MSSNREPISIIWGKAQKTQGISIKYACVILTSFLTLPSAVVTQNAEFDTISASGHVQIFFAMYSDIKRLLFTMALGFDPAFTLQ